MVLIPIGARTTCRCPHGHRTSIALAARLAPSPNQRGSELCDRYPDLPSCALVWVRSALGADRDHRAQPVAVGAICRPASRRRGAPTEACLGEIADEDLRPIVELVGHDVEVAVAVEVEHHRRPAALAAAMIVELASLPGPLLAQRVGAVRAAAVERRTRAS